MPTDALAKQKLILALLSIDPLLERKRSQLFDCLHHISHYVGHLYSATMTTETSQIRCALKYRCPKCMDPINIKAARRKDYSTILKAVRRLGGGEQGERAKVWLISGKFSERFTGVRLSRLLKRKDNRCHPAIMGAWGGEAVAVRFRAIVYSNSPKPSAAFVFNSLVFGAPETELDVSRLEALGLTVEPLHGRLGTAWQLYLERWAKAQIESQSPEEIVEWMTSRARTFEVLGELRGVRARERQEHLDKLHRTMGKVGRIGFWHRMERSEPVLKRIEQDLPLNASNLLNRAITSREREEIMARIKPQVRSVLTPEATPDDMPLQERPMSPAELRARLDSIYEEQRKILKALNGDPDNRVTPPPDKVM